MQAVILAGGRGTRLGQVTDEIPKPMIIIGDKPVLHHQIELLTTHGIDEIFILVNYLKEPIKRYFGNGTSFGAHIHYYEETEPLGTVGGIKEIEHLLHGDFMVFYGDVMIDMDLSRFIAFHNQTGSDCTLTLHPNDHPYDSDLVAIDTSGSVIAFHPKPRTVGWYHNLVNAGAYIFSPAIFNYLEKGKKEDFGRNVFPRIFKETAMFGYLTPEYLKDMGTPDRLEIVRRDYRSGMIRRKNLKYKQKAIFLDRDGVLNVEKSYISKPEDLELYEFAPAAIRKANQSGYLSVVVTNQSVIARNLCTEEDVQRIHHKMETLLGNEHAWLDAIYFCPHHPDKGFSEENPQYKIDCDCRKPKTGMFLRAFTKFNIEPSDSYMIGDSERDIQAGINAGCITVGVRTGYGIRKTRVLPDYMFADLKEAVDFIVDEPYRIHFESIYRAYKQYTGNSPWIVLIGGNTRTGKSTLASYLRLSFLKAGHTLLVVELDNWLLAEPDRKPGMDVYSRFCLPDIERDMENLFRGETIHGSSYTNHPERKAFPIVYNPEGVDIIIIEGVVGLSSAKVRKQAHLKIYTSATQETFDRRIKEYYGWRGKSANEIESLVDKREKDEYQQIQKESNFADLIINPAAS